MAEKICSIASCGVKYKEENEIVCAKCMTRFHTCVLGNSNLVKATTANMRMVDGLKWFCQKCSDKFDDNYNVIKEVRNYMAVMSSWIEKLSSESQQNNEPAKTSYSSIVKATPVQRKLIVVKPKDKEKTKRSETRERIKSVIDPVQVTSIGNAAGNAIRIETDIENDEVFNNLQTNLNNSFEITEPGKKMPKIRIVHFSNELEWKEEEITAAIVKQNSCLFAETDSLKIVKILKNNKNDRVTLIAEVNGKLYNKIIEQKSVMIHWSYCRVFDAFQVMRCYKCNRFAHLAKNCKAQNETCGKCSENHKTIDCQNESLKCINCCNANNKFRLNLDVNHPVWDKNCESNKRRKTLMEKSISYE